MDTRLPRWIAVASAAVTAGAIVLAVPLIIAAERSNPSDPIGEWIVGAFAPGFLASGWWLVRRRPRLSLGWMFLAAAVSVSLAGLAAAYAAAALAEGWPGVDWGLWVFSWLWQPHMAILGLAMLVFPDGGIHSRLQRALVWSVATPVVASMLLSAFMAGPIVTTPDKLDGAYPFVVNPIGVDALRPLTDAVFLPLLLVNLVGVFVPLAWTGVWWFRSQGVRRRQFKWVTLLQIVGMMIPIALVGLPGLAGPIAIVQTLATQLLIVVAILQWRAYEVDVVVRRSVLALSMLTAGMIVYAGVVVVASVILGRNEPVASATGAAVAIFVFGPLSTVIRRGVNRMFYGHRDDPFQVLSDLGRQVATAGDPEEGLRAVVTALADQLRFPYVAIVDRRGHELARSGELELGDSPVDIDLDHYGPVGLLRIGHRRGSQMLTDAEQDLLDTLSRQIEGAVAAHEHLVGLRSVQARLVTARHEERTRIQRDLHDGLGPRLTAVTLNLDAADNHLRAENPDEAAALVRSARVAVRDAIGDVRRLVHSLGDTSVATLGLTSALVRQVHSLTEHSGLAVTTDIEDLGPLSAAYEDAVFRIVGEAVTNVVRHAAAGCCDVAVRRCGTTIEVAVVDDGRYTCGRLAEGIGIRSMRDRAVSLGGRFQTVSGADGTTVRARLPVMDMSAAHETV